MISWTARKQLFYFFIFGLIVFAIVFTVFVLISRPTCGDNKQNQNEEGVDCGGVCAKQCLGEIRDLVVLWSKSIKISEGVYDAAALVENPNIKLRAPVITYRMKIYDNNNVLIALRENTTLANPGERFVVFEPNIEVGFRVPYRAFLEFDPIAKWERDDNYSREEFSVVKKNFLNIDPPRVEIELANKSINTVDNVSVSVVLYDKNKNIKGVSMTVVDSIKGEGSRDVFFTWPMKFEETPDLVEVFIRKGN